MSASLLSPKSPSRFFISQALFLMAALLLLALGSCDQRPQARNRERPAVPAAPGNKAAAALRPDSLGKAADSLRKADSGKQPADSLQAAAAKDSAATAAKAADEALPPGWPVKGPAPLPGSILPANRIVAYYGNPLSKRMGILGELEPEQMFARLDQEVAAWQKADPATPVKPAFHVIVVTAQGQPGPGGKYRLRMSDHVAEKVMKWAEQKQALVFLDIQIGQSTVQEEIPRLAKFLKHPNVHLGIDPEFAMKHGKVPGKRVGTLDAAEINYASRVLADLVTEHQLPPKVLVIHRFTQRMVTNYRKIALDPRVQVVMHMDGWGSKSLKRSTYRSYIQKEPVQFTGFKVFYKNDVRKKGWALMTPADILRLKPQPVYIQYQ
ncbi:MAG: hypothetical protein ACO1O1_17160 [Adhaeribacter sp.]